MAEWPDLALLKQALGVDRDTKDDLLEQALGAAIEGVVLYCGGDKVEVTFSGGVPSVDLVDPSAEEPVEIEVNTKRSRAALQLAVKIHKGPEAPFGVASTFDTGGIYVARHDPILDALLFGERERFGVA